uniref:F-box family-5 n=1 Tax=Oryza alta TaxID=52545 RepID=E0CW58_9ORYZ|nr:F-box family-5 [Oryza alta]
MAEAREEGGIDVLPDALLQHILSLSADEAVKTCVLSRRWRHLWKSTPILRIVKTEDRWDWESFQDFNRTQDDCDDWCSNTYSGNCEDEDCNGCRGMVDETGNDSAKRVLLGGLSEAKNLELIAEPEMENKVIIGAEESHSALVKRTAISGHLKEINIHCKEVDGGVYELVKFLSTFDTKVIIKRMDRPTKRDGHSIWSIVGE